MDGARKISERFQRTSSTVMYAYTCNVSKLFCLEYVCMWNSVEEITGVDVLNVKYCAEQKLMWLLFLLPK